MDNELLVALCLFWLSTTLTLIIFLPMWFMNEAEAFHPHSVNLHNRHNMFMVVSSETECKDDCAVASISAFVAPRGSTTSKLFSMLSTGVAVSGILGSYRWHKMGDASEEETILIIVGMLCLFLVAGFELDVSPQRFLEDKLMITKWLIEKQVQANAKRYTKYGGLNGSSNLYLAAPFQLSEDNILSFIRQSPLLYALYEEDHHRLRGAVQKGSKYGLTKPDEMTQFYGVLHMIGAIGFVILVTSSVMVHDTTETEVGFITGMSFMIFSLLGYMTGKYFWLMPSLRCVIMLWNPFVYEPQFMAKLQRSVDAWVLQQRKSQNDNVNTVVAAESPSTLCNRRTSRSRSRSSAKRGGNPVDRKGGEPVHFIKNDKKSSSSTFKVPQTRTLSYADLEPSVQIPDDEADQADEALDTFFLKFARFEPRRYLKVIGHFLVMSELIALLTPCVAVGIHWITALCTDATPTSVMLDLGFSFLKECVWALDPSCDLTKHCILREK